jgi:NitT/TauT family transport system substrate-binding protein
MALMRRGCRHSKEDMMTRIAIRTALLAAAFASMLPGLAKADDNLKIAIGQRGGWEQCVSELGQNKGFFKKQGLVLDVLYTQGSAETLQSVISNSVDIGIGLGTHALLGAFAKGAPLRGVGASFTSADEQFYYVIADSPIKTMKEADGKSIAISTTGSASNMFALHLAKHFGITLKPQPAGNYTATMTQVLTKQLDIGFSQAPFNLNFVDEGRVRVIARGSDVPALRDMTSRLIVVNVAGLERKREMLRRYMTAYRETLDWMYSDPAAIDAYAEWSRLPKAIAARAPEYMTRKNMEPLRVSGLPGIMEDAVAFKYIPAPLSDAQVAQALPVDALK